MNKTFKMNTSHMEVVWLNQAPGACLPWETLLGTNSLKNIEPRTPGCANPILTTPCCGGDPEAGMRVSFLALRSWFSTKQNAPFR